MASQDSYLLCYEEVSLSLTGFIRGRVSIEEFAQWFELTKGDMCGSDLVKDLMFAIKHRLDEWERSHKSETEIRQLLACELGGHLQ